MNTSDLYQEGIFHQTLPVIPAYDDSFGHMNLQSIARLTSDNAYAHTKACGLTEKILESLQIYIVLVWSAFEFYRIPDIGEEVTFHTWAGKSRLGLYPRRGMVTSEGGELLIASSSQWLLINRDNRRMNTSTDIAPFFQAVSLKDELPLPPHRRKFPDALPGRMQATVKPYMIDFNCHMNNSWYLDWAWQCLDEDYRRKHSPKHLWAEYRHELYDGETAQINYHREQERLYMRGYRQEELSFSVILDC